MTKYIFVTGGVVSGLGKGIAASSIALLLKARGYKVFMQKFDPYINVDPGTMSPYQHGEVYVTADGSETDLDLGHYERFIDEELNYSSNITTGKIYSMVIEKERRGKYDGGTVQIVPHVTNEIKAKVFEAAKTSKADFVITEVGGTIGDLESSAFIEALRQIRDDLGKSETLFMHTTLVPYLYGSGELKSKPTQHSVIQLRSLGIQPDIIITRSPFEMGKEMRQKIALYCSIPFNNIIEAIDVPNIYQIPINFYHNKMDEVALKQFGMPLKKSNMRPWFDLVKRVDNLEGSIKVALVGKYVELHDAYLSVAEALRHAGYRYNKKLEISWVNSRDITNAETAKKLLGDAAAIVVPSASGEEGTEGMLGAINYARENNVPFLGTGLGMQLAIVEYARNIAGIKDANTEEFDSSRKDHLIVEVQKESKDTKKMLILGNLEITLEKNSLIHKLYGKQNILERHRQRYKFNSDYKKQLEEHGLLFTAYNKKEKLYETIEIKNHPFYLACQFYPEFKSRPTKAHPIYLGLIEAILKENKY